MLNDPRMDADASVDEMPKQPDLIAAEMQGDATIPPALVKAGAQIYEQSKRDPALRAKLKAIAASSAAKVEDATPQAVVDAAPQSAANGAGTNGNGAIATAVSTLFGGLR